MSAISKKYMQTKSRIPFNMDCWSFSRHSGLQGKFAFCFLVNLQIHQSYRITEDIIDELTEEYGWLKRCTLIREMIQVKKCQVNTLGELARNVVRRQITTSLTYNQVPRSIPYLLRRSVALPEIYNIPL